MATAVADSYTFTSGTTLYAGLPNPSGALITTLSLVNTSGSTQAANFVSPMLGMPLVQGDVPSGQYPQFQLTDGTPCPATIYNDTSWPDASKRFCGVFFRTPTSIAGSGTLTINVKNGGTAPAASSRTLSDLNAANLSVELTGVTNLSGVWTASLNTAITDATEIVVIGDGPAGKLWRIRGAFKQSGAAHGQLECYHYVLAAQNSAGGLSHLEYLPRVAQLWGDVASPTPTRRVMTCVMKSGATTLLTMQGHDTTETPGSNIGLTHYSSFFVADTDAKWTFVQGGGTTAARPTVRALQDKTYFVKSRLVPAYDLTVSPTSSSSVDYRAMGAGPMTRNMATTGERIDIGVLPSWSVRHILTQAVVDERVVRVAGMCSSGWRGNIRRSSTGQIIPLTTGTYTGMGTSSTTARAFSGAYSGVNEPTDVTSLWNSEFEPSHRPSASYYPYILTGEPQYADLLEEQANGLMLTANGGTPNTFSASPFSGSVFASGGSERNFQVGATSYYCCATLVGSNLSRLAAWTTRDWAHLLAILPDTAPDGVARKTYVQDVVNASFDMINAYNASRPTSWQDGGFYYFRNTDQVAEAPWAQGYLSNAVATACAVLGNPTNVVSFRDHLAKFWRGVHDRYDIACVAAFNMLCRDDNLTRIENLDDMTFDLANGSMTWNSTTNVFTIGSGGNGNFDYTPTNGDKISFESYFSANKPFASTPNWRRYYVVNASGQTFQLSATPGGSALDVTTDLSVTRMYASVANFSPRIAFQGSASSFSDGYLANTRSAMRMLEATGNTNVNPARVAQDSNWSATGATFTSDPKNAIATAYPA